MKKIILPCAMAVVTGASFWLAVPAHAAKVPLSLATDQRLKQVAYDPNQVYEVTGTYGYQTTIEFAHDEQIKVRTIGDSIAWQTVLNGNRLFMKPVEPNAVTNMTIVTNKRTYYFKLNSATGQKDVDMTFLVRFLYPDSSMTDVVSTTQDEQLAIAGADPTIRNPNYASAGNKKEIQLKHVFDDGEFTYFQFEKNTEIPSFYIVGSDGTESVVNTRREGAYMVVERTGRMFTLRNGKAHLCVENTGDKKELTAVITDGGR